MSSSDVAIKSMDLARSITDFLGKGGAVSGLVGEIMSWLARERINGADFTYCLNKTKAILYPNSKGLEIQSSLRESDEKLRRNPFVAGLRLLGAGSLGRWMAQSPEYCYLATTVATLLVHHDMRYAATAICEMVLSEEKQADDSTTALSHRYLQRRFKLVLVLEKIVESITLNVVNCGHDLGSLPPQLSDICGHTCNARTFATVTMALAKSSDNLIIRCKTFLVDIFMWTLAHIVGNVELSIIGQVVYRENTGSFQRSLLFFVDEDCSCGQQHCSKADEHADHAITVSTSMNGDLRTIFEWSGRLSNPCGSFPRTRALLYHFGDSAGCSLGALLPSEKRDILQVSQTIILWILERSAYRCSIGRSNESIVPKASGLLIGDLLSRWPRICNESVGGGRVPATVAHVSAPRDRIPYNPYEVLYNFCGTRAILDACSSRCVCPSCAQHGSTRSPFRGCLKAMAGSAILRMIAHAIADGFGADNVSGMSDPGSIDADVSRLLNNLLGERVVPWKHWFGLATCVYLGCSTSETGCGLLTSPLGRTTGEVIAVQYGSLVVAAPWINLHNQVSVVASFGFECAQARIRGIKADWATLSTESTACSSMGALDLSTVRLPQHTYYEADATEILLQSTIRSTHASISPNSSDPFILSTLVKIDRYTRIVDPADIFRAMSSSHLPRCSHDKSTMPVGPFPSSSRIWTFEEAVGLWETSNFGDRSSTWTSYTTILDSRAKYNTLLILSPRGCIVKTTDCCFACAQTELDTRFKDSKARRVLSIAIDDELLLPQYSGPLVGRG